MSPWLKSLVVAACFLAISGAAVAQDDGPPIAITSPDTGTTFALGTIKTHSLYWNKNEKMLVARVTFTDDSSDDTHEFRLPGVNFDPAKGVFAATSSTGVVIPIAHFKKTFFMKSIQILPNANIRVLHPKGVITVILEAISPEDPAMHPSSPTGADAEGTHSVTLKDLVQ